MTPPAILFSPRSHWPGNEPGLKETLTWQTNVITADNDSEQRISLRSKPRRTLEYLAKAVNAREAALLGNLVWGNQPTLMGIPVWQDAILLTAPLAIGATAASVDTTYGGVTGREFANGTFVGFWSDPFTWEIQTVSGVTPPGGIAMSATAKAWPAGTTVFPVTLGYLNPVEKQQRKSGAVNEVAIVAACDVLADTAMVAAATWSGSQFNGADLLAAPFHNWVELPGSEYHRTMLLEDSGTGVFAYYNPNAAPIPVRDFYWTNLTRASIAQLKGFLANRLGRFNPFYAPTWLCDFVLASNVATTDTTLTIQSCGYSEYVFPADAVRRTLVLMTPTAFVPVTVNRAVDNGDGTETLTLSGQVGTAFAAGFAGAGLATTISYLTPVRLDRDAVTIEYKTSGIASAKLSLAEVPLGAAIGPAAGNMVALPNGRYLSGTITALGSGTITGVVYKMRFLADTVGSGISFLAVTGTNTTLTVSCGPNGDGINTRFFGTFLGGTTNQILFLVPNASLPAPGTGLCLYAAYSAGGGAACYLEDDNGVSYGSFTDPTLLSGNPPVGNTTIFIGQSTGGSGGGGNVTVDAVEVLVQIASGPFPPETPSQIPTETDVQVVGLWSFNAQNLVPVSSFGSTLSSVAGLIGAPVEYYIPGGIWIAPPL